MTLHPLTKELLSARLEYLSDYDGSIDRIVRIYLNRRAGWLKNELGAEGYHETIDKAFQVTPETLEEKFHAIRRKHDHKYPSPQDFWDAVLKEFAEVAIAHFSNQSSGETVNYSRQEDSTK